MISTGNCTAPRGLEFLYLVISGNGTVAEFWRQVWPNFPIEFSFFILVVGHFFYLLRKFQVLWSSISPRNGQSTLTLLPMNMSSKRICFVLLVVLAIVALAAIAEAKGKFDKKKTQQARCGGM